ncbi:bifunctional diguanylate cyclase/phosphodiesterase [Paraburkholderia sp. DHOC27]|uniref:putative bifunctional diguanylate cyclase/phosphodiesterase n=1 Tax=Paraburkholderia sp. DHOC27 TaxID=2303330 RepID=UPI000E3D64F2|nr:EAL domain-containing protein [Paraburkholderia sp. DHOC27]RFU49628.1 EAL domain-containing protein [Paraburkholderia sp. DHOC27]
MVSVARVMAAFKVDVSDPELVRSQMQAFRRQIPLLYFILVISTMAVAVTHVQCAPAWVAIYVPGALCVACVIRCLHWWRARHVVLTVEQAVPALRRSMRLVGVIAVGFTAWAWALFRYGPAYEQAQVAFYMATTVVGCVFCLMHLRAAALWLLTIVIGSFTVCLMAAGRPVFIAMAVDMIFVGVALAFIVHLYHRNFAGLEHSKRELLASQAITQKLSDDNFRLANIDSLTGLPNRRSFFSSLTALAEQHLSETGGFHMGLIDLDGFKQVNDIYGHSSGDVVLREVGARLLALADPAMFFARLGGDEFGVIIQRHLSETELDRLGQTLCEQLARPYTVGGNTAELSGTIGWAGQPTGAVSVTEMFERADAALYVGKESRRGTAVVFSAEHENRVRRASLVAQELKAADLDAELYLEFQPICDVRARSVVGFEALGRWRSPKLGQVRPDEFIRIAERTDLIRGVTEVLLRKALAEAANWPPALYLSFNLSALDISSVPRSRRLLDIVGEGATPAARVHFEITETAVTRDFRQARASLTLIKEAGCHVSLDDFGTGYSSLSYVHRLPFDTIKIDRSFVAEVDTDLASGQIIKSVIDLCRNLGLACVVEGVETDAQREILTFLGARVMQGYLFGRPAAANALPLVQLQLAAL